MYMISYFLPFRFRNLLARRLFRKENIAFGRMPFISGYLPDLKIEGRFIIGSDCAFHSFRLPQRIRVLKGAVLKLGDCCGMNDGVVIYVSKKVTIGPHTKIGDMVYIYDTSFHQVAPDIPVKYRPVFIGSNVWIGAHSMILAGSRIGNHSVIGAGSIVSGEIPPRSLAVGCPAKVVKTFDAPDSWERIG